MLLLHDVLGVPTSQGQAGSIIEIGALRALALAASGDRPSAFGALTGALALARRHGYDRVLADEGAPVHALLAQLSAARPGQQHPAGCTGPGYLAALLRACGPAGAAPPAGRAAAAPLGLAEPLTGPELEVLRLLAAGQVQPAHRPRPGGGTRHGQKACDPHPGQARRPATWNSRNTTSISQRPAASDPQPHTHLA